MLFLTFDVRAFCTRYLTCTGISRRKRIDYIIFHMSDIGKNMFM